MRSLILTLGILALLCTFACNPDDEVPNIGTTILDTGVELFYYSKRNGVVNIYKTDDEGVETPIIIDNDHHDWWVRVSPDKSTILWYKSPTGVPSFEEYNNYDDAELWMADIDGSNQRKVIDLADYNWVSQGVADWSPDGTELVMAVTDDSGHWHIYITDADGSNPQKISQRNSLFADPSWSPDGQKIVYTAFPEGFQGILFENLEIHIMDRDGSNEIRLTDDSFQDNDPYWSPDSREIAFETFWDGFCILGKWSIRKYSFETQTTVDLVKQDNANTVPRWSKDSKYLYFSRFICAEFARLARIDRDGSNLEIALENDAFPYHDCDVVD